MSKKLKIGIVGCGAIGKSLALSIKKTFSKDACICALFDIDPLKAKKLSFDLRKDDLLSVKSLRVLIKISDLVIECASSKVSWKIARLALLAKRDVLIMSVGGIIDKADQLERIAKNNSSKVYIPSGAISGIDALKAAKMHSLEKVTLTTTKNPNSFKGVKYIEEKNINLKGLKKDKLIFCGSAREAVKYFPQNINVAAILSICGLGDLKTKVKIIASPFTKRNIHEIEIISEAGIINTRTENILHPSNPKTSFLAYLSALALVKRILSPIQIGS